MKIPFDIKYRPEIESGKYKVVTRNGLSVRIICWDLENSQPIVGVISCQEETPDLFNSDGKYWRKGHEDKFDLFILTDEPELTEFEKAVVKLCQIGKDEYPCYEFAKKYAPFLLDISKKELCEGCTKCIDEYWRGKKEASEELSRCYRYEGPTIPTYYPLCYHEGHCTNPYHDCINCSRNQVTVRYDSQTASNDENIKANNNG